uniref:Uncharacterized protein n=1 Tax=Megaselia scalaris TaxID=36166 RepID=T1GI38_MEGSC
MYALSHHTNVVSCLENQHPTNIHAQANPWQDPIIDFRQAYDTSTRDELYCAINHFGIPVKLIRHLMLCRTARTISERFQTLCGRRISSSINNKILPITNHQLDSGENGL